MTEELEDYVIKLDKLSIIINNSIIDFINNKITKSELINTLFRSIHSLKAITYYHKFEEISILLEKTEDILFFIKNYTCSFNQSVIDWFENFSNQIEIWVIQIQQYEEPEFYAIEFDTAPVVQCKNYISSKLNEVYDIVLLNRDSKVSKLLAEILSTKFKFVDIVTTKSEAINLLKMPGKKILIADLKYPDGHIMDLIVCLNDIEFNFENLYILSKFSKESSLNMVKEKLAIDNVYNINSLKMADFKTMIVKKYEQSNTEIEIPINKGQITLVELARSIEPLPDTLMELKTLCFDSNSNINQIIKVVEQDPMFSAIILREINSPYIGLPNRVSKISIAVSLLGKKQIGALAITEVANESFDSLYLDAYDISLEELILVSKYRVRFVSEWIKFIDIPQDARDDLIAVMHMLPLGMLLTNQALIINEKVERFKNLQKLSKSITSLETNLLGFNNLHAVEKLFSIWNMPQNMKKIIAAAREFGYDSASNNLQLQGHIINLAFELFKYNGEFKLTKNLMREAERGHLSGNDMKNIFAQITHKKSFGNILDLKKG